MNEFNAENQSSDEAVPTPIAPVAHPAPVATVAGEQVRTIPVEDFGLGVMRLIQDGGHGILSLGKGDAVLGAVKTASSEITGMAKQVVRKVTGALNGVPANKE